MAKGRIKWFDSRKGYGFIERPGQDDLFIHISQWQGHQGSIPRQGEQVTFEEGQGRKGPEAKNVRPLAMESDEEYRFLNPYNFVRILTKSRPENHVLGNCPPPPHDRYVGLTGRITCKVETVTPLFISDSHAIEEEIVKDGRGRERAHYTYRFFQLDGKPAIPASSLRGMVRSVFEAVTNSCFSTLSGEEMPGDKRLSYHLPPGEALKLVPGRVRKVDNQWMLELLPGTTPVVPGQRPSDHQYAAWVQFYRPLQRSKTKAKSPHSPYSRRRRLTRDNLQLGKSYWALIESVHHPLRGFHFWNVVALAEGKEQLPEPKPGQLIVKGYLCINNQNIENKHDERLFFRSPDNHSLGQPLPLSDKVRKRYKELITDYQERHRDDIFKRKRRGKDPEQPEGREPAFSRFIVNEEARELREGDLVYAMLERTSEGVVVKFLVPVSVPRVSYEHTIGELLGERANERLLCRDFNRLCPACRVFGWVREDAGNVGPEKPTAYAGRVRFSQGTLTHSAGELPETTLTILSTPKPTTTPFYLLNKNGQPDPMVTYDREGARLRGRKFYRHQGEAKESEYRRTEKSDHNRTVRGALKPGASFTFTVDFENLAPLELGALLYALELEDGMYHRLGYAKPLGFGSVKITVEKVEIVDWQERLQSIEAGAGWNSVSEQHWKQYKANFLHEMRQIYGSDFDEVLADLRALLGDPPDLPIHYPRPTKQFDPDHPQFEWFVGNKRRIEDKRRGKGKLPEPVALPLAKDDRTGLPLIDKKGKEVR